MNYDVIIVGSGPAGLGCAYNLSKKDLKVLIIDKKENASWVQYNTACSFVDAERLGIPKDLIQPIENVYYASKNAEIRKNGKLNVINRRLLLSWLADRCKANGVEFAYKSVISEIKISGKDITEIKLKAEGLERDLNAKVFVDCSGVGRVFASKIGIEPKNFRHDAGAEYLVPLKCESNTVDLFVGKKFAAGYGWIFPINEKEAIIGCGSADAEMKKSIKKCLDGMWEIPRVKERCEFKPLEYNAAVFRTGPPVKKLVSGNVVLIGDVALQANPLVGEGVRFVLDASEIAADAIDKAIKAENLSLLAEYEKKWLKKYEKSYKIAWWLQSYILKNTYSDETCDKWVEIMGTKDDEFFMRLLKADFSYSLIFKELMKHIKEIAT
jgi:flavin-dependent dehydrogenase